MDAPNPLSGSPEKPQEGWGGQSFSPASFGSSSQPMSQPNPPPQQPTQGPMVPPPPAPEIGIRTMNSDAQTIKSSGGDTASPKPFNLSDFAPPKSSGGQPISQPTMKASLPNDTHPAESHPKKGIVLTLGIVLIVLAVAAVGYFFIWPIISSPETPAEELVVEEQPTMNFVHSSFLAVPADAALSLSLSDLSLQGIQSGLAGISGGQLQPGAVQELVLSFNGAPVDFATYLSLLLPELDTTALSSSFDQDFTTLLYYNEQGVWPVYIAKVKPDAILAAQPLISSIEQLSSLSNVFIASPGLPNSQGFKDGQVNQKPTRYLSFSSPGAALNYGWFNNTYLVVTTSYPAIQEALTKLGL